MQRQQKYFLFLGLPFFVVFFVIGFLSHITGIVLAIFMFSLGYLALLHNRKENRLSRLTKIAIILGALQIGGMYASLHNPLLWGAELKLGVDRSDIITPENEYVAVLEEQFHEWVDTNPNATWIRYSFWKHHGLLKYEVYEGDYYHLYNIEWDELDDFDRLAVIDHYVRRIVINYTSDLENYGYRDFKSTPNDILKPWVESNFSEMARDDCDGIAMVTVSLLKRMGYDAYIGSGKAHWFSVVRLPDVEHEVFLNTWQSVRTYSYFNEHETYITQSPLLTLYHLLMWRQLDSDFEAGVEFLGSFYYIPTILLGFVAAIMIVLLIQFPNSYVEEYGLISDDEDHKDRKRKIESKKWGAKRRHPLRWIAERTYIRVGNPFRKRFLNEWLNIGFLYVVLVGIIIFLHSNLETLGSHTYVVLLAVGVLLIRMIDSDYIPKLFHKIKAFRGASTENTR